MLLNKCHPLLAVIEAEDKGKTDKLLEQVRSKYLDKVAEVDHLVNEKTGSFDDESSECDDSRSVLELETALQTKDKEIQSLTVQLQTFQQVATQRKQLQEHSKTQSAVVVNLKKELEAAHVSIKMLIALKFIFHLL